MSAVTKGLEHLRFRYEKACRGVRLRGALERAGVDWLSRPSLAHIEDTLLELCGRAGTYFEAGAADGYIESTSYYLERFHDCRGVLVEPVPRQFETCRDLRPASTVVNCALVPPAQSGERIAMSWAERMSFIRGARTAAGGDEQQLDAAYRFFGVLPFEFEVVGRTISEVLSTTGHEAVDLMTLDLEGYEVEALSGLDLERHRPRYLMVEMLEPERMWAELDELLARVYRPAGWITPTDYLYARDGEPVPALSTYGALGWRPPAG